jgi:two-component system, response regulator, stage 0 sporulation protein F
MRLKQRHKRPIQNDTEGQLSAVSPIQEKNRDKLMGNILIVDDQVCVRALIAEGLISDGHQVRGVGNIKSAQEQVESGWPDVVLLDLYLDGPQGFGLLDEIQRQHPQLPVIIVTAYDSFRNDPRLSQASEYVMKNMGFVNELRKAVASALSEKPVRGTASGDHAASRDGIEIAPALSLS